MTGFVVSRRRRLPASIDVATPEGGQHDRDKLLRNTVIECKDASAYVLEIQKLWQDAAESFLAIGHYLVAAKQSLRHGEFEHMVRQQLPFDRNVAHRLRRVAEAIGSGRLDRSKLPGNYTTIYRFVTMDPLTLARACNEGVMHPEVTHKEITAFLKRTQDQPVIESWRATDLGREHKQLSAELRVLEKEIDVKRRRLAEIERFVGSTSRPVIDGDPSTVV